jgi:hypothetical protein
MLLVQFGTAHLRAARGSALEPMLALALAISVGALLLALVSWLVTRSRRALRSWRGKRRRLHEAANAERRARALMSELCPHGWHAQITVFGSATERARIAPDGESAAVALDWTELEDASGRPAVVRRVWAPTIVEALQAMVADRRTDETLEQIERGAVADGAPWPDL